MAMGTSLLLIAAGAILRYAVTAHVSGLDVQTVGVILMVVGVIGFITALIWMIGWLGPRRRYPEDEVPPPPPRTPVTRY
jgi:hypothetical protein